MRLFAVGAAAGLAVLARRFATGLAALAAHHIVAAVGATARAAALPGTLAVLTFSLARRLAALAANPRGTRHGRVAVHGLCKVFKEAAQHVVATCVTARSLAVTARSTTSILTRVHLIHWETKINAHMRSCKKLK